MRLGQDGAALTKPGKESGVHAGRRLLIRALLTVACIGVLSALPSSAEAANTFGYPFANDSMTCPPYSTFGYCKRQCVDFAAWKLNVQWGDTNNKPPHKFSWGSFSYDGDGNAIGWQASAVKHGFKVNSTPQLGAVAWWGKSKGSYGHVGIVSKLYMDGSGRVDVQQYNSNAAQLGPGKPSTAVKVRAEKYLHIHDTPPKPKTADINGDGTVDIFDLSIMLSQYHKPATANANAAKADLNRDGEVNVFDLSILLTRYGTSGLAVTARTAAAVADPPPSTMTVTADKTVADPGDTVTVHVVLNAGAATNGVRASLGYRRTRLKYVSSTVDDGTWQITPTVTDQDGVVDIQAGNSGPVSGPLTLATITFKPIGGGNAPLQLWGDSSVVDAATNLETLTSPTDAALAVTGPVTVDPSDNLTPDDGVDLGGDTTAGEAAGTTGGAITGGATTGGTVTRAQITAWIRTWLRPAAATRGRKIARTRRYKRTVTAPAVGRLKVTWTARRRGKNITLAHGQRMLAASQRVRLTVKVTRAGSRLLKHTRAPVRVTARALFTPVGAAPVTVTRRFRLRH
jgi:hypothetical protein